MAKDACGKRKELLAQKMNRIRKKRIIKTIVWRVTLYGAETWTSRKEDIRRLEAFEKSRWRRMEKVSWEDMMPKEKVLESVGESRKLVETIVQRKRIGLDMFCEEKDY